MSPERLGRHFIREDGTYRIISDLREICLFSTHNLLRDPPFSQARPDILPQLLIYLDGALQDRVIPLFHYASACRRLPVPRQLGKRDAAHAAVRHR